MASRGQTDEVVQKLPASHVVMEAELSRRSYVIITPAHNEEALIEKTIHSMMSQTVRPLKWVVVNDNSTDRTGEIVQRYAAENSFIQLINMRQTGERNFGNKVRAFNRGLNEVRNIDYRFIGNIDADISLEENYFERLLHEFDSDPKLGIAGGMVSSYIDNKFVSQNVALDSVAGAVQLFRRECFEQIGGYLALSLGGIDSAAEIIARMKGWKVRTFPEISVLEHRRTGSATARPVASRVKEGIRCHSLGYSFLFMCMRCLYRLRDRPIVIGSVATLFGFVKGMIKGNPIVLPRNVVGYLRAEQRGKLVSILKRSH